MQIYSKQMLNYLDSLLKHGNFTKAAKDLYISQPHLTQTIKRIEKELSTEIIDRNFSPLQLTPAGKRYYQFLVNTQDQQDQFQHALYDYTHPEKKVIHVGILPSLGSFLLPLFLPAFIKKYPDIKIELHELLPEKNEAKVLAGEIDFFIGQNPETISPYLEKLQVGRHGYYTLIPKSSPFYQEDHFLLPSGTISIKALLNEPMVLTKRGSAIRRQVDYLCQKYKIEPNVVLETSNIFTAVNLAKADMGLTFFAESIKVLDFNHAFNIYPLPLSLLSLEYFISYDKKKILDTFEREFIKLFETEISTMLSPHID